MHVTARLAAVESKRMLTSPWLLLGVVATGAFLIRQIGGDPVVFHRDATFIASGLLPLAVFAYLAGFGNASLPRRSGVGDLLSTLPISSRRRAAAGLAASLSAGAVAAVVCVGTVLWSMAADAIGRPPIGELLAGIAAVVVAAIAGLALGHRFGSIVSGLAPLVAFAALTIVLAGQGRMRWLNLFVEITSRNEVVDLARRVPWLHLAYLAAIAASLVASVVAVRPVRLAALGAVVAGVLGWAQLRPADSRDEARVTEFVTTLDRHQCAASGDVTICLLPGFDGWRDDIETEVSRIVDSIPESTQRPPKRLVVAQLVDSVPDEGYDPTFVNRTEVVAIGDRVGAAVALPKAQPIDASSLTALAAWRAGLPASPMATYLPSDEPMRGADEYCTRGDGLAVAAAFLAVAGTDHAADLAASTDHLVSPDGSATSLVLVGGVQLTLEQAQLLGELLDHPEVEKLATDVRALLDDDVALAQLRSAGALQAPERPPTYPDFVTVPPPCP